MNSHHHTRALAAALSIAALAATPTHAIADIKDYRFDAVDHTMKVGPDTLISVKLLNRKTGKPVSDAVIFAMRLDMSPDAMEEMTTKVVLEQTPSPEPGLYRFKARVTMAGRWRLSLGAKVQGEEGTVEGKLVIEAVE